jgi:hypothetical protein
MNWNRLWFYVSLIWLGALMTESCFSGSGARAFGTSSRIIRVGTNHLRPGTDARLGTSDQMIARSHYLLVARSFHF